MRSGTGTRIAGRRDWNRVNKPSLAFVILTWNSQNVIERCLRSVFSLSSFNVSAYVVDNGSYDKTVDVLDSLKKEYNKLYVVKLPYNKGTTISRNLALKKISNNVDYICILDSDTEVNDSAIFSMIKTLDNPNIGIVGPEMRDENGIMQNSGRKIPTLTIKFSKILPFKKIRKWGESLEYYNYPSDNSAIPVGYLMSACWMFRPCLLAKIGYLDEKIFYAPEDVDYCISCWKSGLSVVKDQNAKILHSWQRLSRKKLFSKHNWEHIKGLAYLFWKHRYLWSARKIERLVADYSKGAV